MLYFTLSIVNKKLKMCKVDPLKGHEEVKVETTIVLFTFFL
jgi:hypothetical protein